MEPKTKSAGRSRPLADRRQRSIAVGPAPRQDAKDRQDSRRDVGAIEHSPVTDAQSPTLATYEGDGRGALRVDG
jgi:hypothetical protein